MEVENKISRQVMDAGMYVHRQLGPGLLESAYEVCLLYELKEKGLKVERQKEVKINYRGVNIDAAYKIDLLIEDKVLIELKTVATLMPIHTAQTLTYLKLSGCRLGMLINFNEKLFYRGVKRIVL